MSQTISPTFLLPRFNLDLTFHPFLRELLPHYPDGHLLAPKPILHTVSQKKNFSERPVCLYHFHHKIRSAASSHLQDTVPAAQRGLQEPCLPGFGVSLVASCAPQMTARYRYTVPSPSVPFHMVFSDEKQWLAPPHPLGLTSGMTSFWKPPLDEAR